MKSFKSLIFFLLVFFWVVIFLIVFYVLVCVIVIFIENDYGMSVSKVIVYNIFWFNFLYVYLLVVLIGIFIKFKVLERKRYVSFFFYSFLIFIILGVVIMCFFGVEGFMYV